MTLDLAIDNFTDEIQTLAIDENARDLAWEQSQSFSRASSRWRAYLNRLCLNAFLPWLQEELQEEFPTVPTVWPNYTTLPSFWEFVNGFAITMGTKRLVVIPSDTMDTRELRVPQEWVDIPSWAGDYYLAVQVNTEDGLIEIGGYARYSELKKRENYDVSDSAEAPAGLRTYCLNEKDLFNDLNVLWVISQLSQALKPAPGRENPAPTMPLEQANNLLQRLGNPAVVFPRTEIPFEQWATLLEHGGWRQRLYERRLGLPEQRLIPQWVKEGISSLAQQIGWKSFEFQHNVGGKGKRGGGYRSAQQTTKSLRLARDIIIAGQPYQLQVFPEDNPETGIWYFRLINSSPGGSIPAGFTLRFLTEDLQPFENNECTATTATEWLQIELQFEPGEGVVWETSPLPENYDREILRF